MPVNRLILLLNTLRPISLSLDTQIRGKVITERFKKGHTLSSPATPTHAIWYIVSGLAKEYYYDEAGKLVISAFWKENELIVDVDSFFGKVRSERYIQLIEECTLLTLNSRQAHELQNLYPEVQPLGYSILTAAKRKDNERSKLIVLSGTKSFKHFSENFPLERISVSDAAAYLGLSRQTLSMMKASDARKSNAKKIR